MQACTRVIRGPGMTIVVPMITGKKMLLMGVLRVLKIRCERTWCILECNADWSGFGLAWCSFTTSLSSALRGICSSLLRSRYLAISSFIDMPYHHASKRIVHPASKDGIHMTANADKTMLQSHASAANIDKSHLKRSRQNVKKANFKISNKVMKSSKNMPGYIFVIKTGTHARIYKKTMKLPYTKDMKNSVFWRKPCGLGSSATPQNTQYANATCGIKLQDATKFGLLVQIVPQHW
mmetsp:Transcript_25798/g.41341  ORF Transcript_25798/g.41341 Transcript_25798/m.41341 type:complete len:236 (-) Transcript_25798:66-773(-)